jgi:uncharacterized membrane protein YccC
MKVYNNYTNPFESLSGSMRLVNYGTLASVIIGLFILSFFLTITKISGLIVCLFSVAVLAIIYQIFKNPKTGIYLLIILGFLVTGLTRYLAAPWGLAIDGILVLIYLALFFKSFGQKNCME